MLELIGTGNFPIPLIVLQTIVLLSTSNNKTILEKYNNYFQKKEKIIWNELFLSRNVKGEKFRIINFNKKRVIYYKVFDDTTIRDENLITSRSCFKFL